MHYLLFYDYAPDYLERRGEVRSAHLTLAWASHGRGELVLGGVMGDPVEGALLLFKADGPEVVEAFVAEDPYVTRGLVTGWRVVPWLTVAGAEATTPVRP